MKIFVSSTFRDLEKHRAAVADALERLGVQLARMETFRARPEEPSAACLDEVQASDLFVGIYAHRYGFIPAGSAVSITEAEFNHAVALRRPTFCFFVDKDFPWDQDLIESDPGYTLLEAFKARVAAHVVRDVFTTPEVLATRVATAIARYLIADPRQHGARSVARFARTSVADTATAVFVDVMRMACTAASDLTRRANEARYNEFVDIADQHLSDFRVQVTRLGGDEDPDFTKRCADVEAGLAWAITRLRRGPTLDRPWHEFAQRLVTLAERVNTAAADGAPDYYKTRVQEVAPITERALGTETADTLANPDTFALRRFSAQSRVIGHLRQTAALAIATVRDDVDRVLAIPYFTIDRFLLRIMGQPKGAIA